MGTEPSPEAMDLRASAHVDSDGAVADDDEVDYSAFENERCGICADVVIDRGVLDCCQHWFCFTCIDNWSTITTLCPLCKNEFQLITCLPVYDTIGNIKAEEHLLSRDDDWSIQGENNTLSFPSYYIDEDAVICLDGDRCKIRSGVATAEEDLNFDTSIACDSCDIWYHAFCVGFNPECTTSESSWLCPRCITEEAQQKSNGGSMQNLGSCPAPINPYQLGFTVEPSFSGRLSVSVADDGETAVVVSMVEGQPNSDPCKTSLSEFGHNFKADIESETSLSDTNSGNDKLDVQLENSGCIELICDSLIDSNENESNGCAPENEENSESFLDISASMDCRPAEVDFVGKSLPSLEGAEAELTVTLPDNDEVLPPLAPSTSENASCYSVTESDSKATDAGAICNPCSPDGSKVPSPSRDTSETTNEEVENKSTIDLQLGFSATTLSADGPSADFKMGITDDIKPKNNEISEPTRKHGEERQPNITSAACLISKTRKKEMVSLHPAKKAKSDGKSLILPARSQVNASVFDNAKSSSRIALDNDDYLTYTAGEETKSPDIMNAVQGKHRYRDGLASPKTAHESTDKKDTAPGLRVKKIMRRSGEEKESSNLIQKLGKEIREAVQDKSCDNVGNHNDFDVKLLTAFRAAIVKPKEEPSNKLGPSRIGMKKSFLQKGKIRENLTKKIYATSTGRRKRAWDRDCEIEFWKPRCTKSKSEKVETLHSILEVLKKATNSISGTDQGPDGKTTDSILSRVYLADTSVFPRKDDIKPLSALAGSSLTVSESGIVKTPTDITRRLEPVKVVSSDCTGKTPGTLNFTKQASSRKENSNGMATKSPHISESSGSKGGAQNPKKLGSHSDNIKSDKRRWALEVLARKNASANLSAGGGNGDDKEDALKRNYPLLAQLPMDMRPVLVPSNHKKVPSSVRQVQLYRITEHYLRRTNLPLMRRTADTELAVADAVNIEKEIFERSNSKLVYINLCSNALSQCCNKPPLSETIAASSTIAEVTDLAEETSSHPTAGKWNNVEEALKLAGLSDSPPSSPCSPTKDVSEADDAHEITREQGLENILDMDSRPELDIYGDFEYDLEDEGYIGVSTLLQQQNDPKLKVVFSTLKCEESDNPKAYISDNETTIVQYKKKDMLQCDTGETLNEIKADATLTPKLSEGEIHKEPSLAEYEELYGPEDLSTNKLPDEATGEMDRPMKVEEATKSRIACESDKYESGNRATTSEFEIEDCAENSFADGRAPLNHESCGTGNSPAHSQMSKNTPKERKVKLTNNKPSDASNSVSKKVEAYIKEHIRPLCKSGVITVEQYRWAVKKTADKVMKYHGQAKNASFLIKEGEKVKKLAMGYVEASQQQEL